MALLVAAAVFTRGHWLPVVMGPPATTAPVEDAREAVEDPDVLRISPQARKNLGLVSKPALLQSYSRTIQIPGVIIDQPGGAGVVPYLPLPEIQKRSAAARGAETVR